jgi:hypothetical protein
MKKLRKVLTGICLAAVLTFSIVPTSVVHADDSGGPQGTSNSTTTKAPPPPSSAELLRLLIMLLMWLFG